MHEYARQLQDFLDAYFSPETRVDNKGWQQYAALLDRILKQTRNQHACAGYYQKMCKVQRIWKRIHERIPTLLLISEQRNDSNATPKAPTVLLGQISDLFRAAMTSCVHAYRSVRALAQLRFFLPFSLVCLATLARLFTLAENMLRDWERIREASETTPLRLGNMEEEEDVGERIVLPNEELDNLCTALPLDPFHSSSMIVDHEQSSAADRVAAGKTITLVPSHVPDFFSASKWPPTTDAPVLKESEELREPAVEEQVVQAPKKKARKSTEKGQSRKQQSSSLMDEIFASASTSKPPVQQSSIKTPRITTANKLEPKRKQQAVTETKKKKKGDEIDTIFGSFSW